MPVAGLRAVLGRRRALIAATCAAVCLGAGSWVRFGRIDPALLDLDASTSTAVVDRNGVPLYEALSGGGARSTRLSADRLPPMLVDATIAAEDRRFWRHAGVDPIATVRAGAYNVLEGRVVQGGSTITQQVAKLLLDRQHLARARSAQPTSAGRTRGRGFRAKLQEAVLALRLEHRFTKQEILALYLNLAAYGNQLHGAAHASRAYFGREPSGLTAAEAAFLAGLPQRPSVFNPYRRSSAAIARQRVVLRRMEAAGVLTPADAAHAADEQLAITRDAAPFRAPHFVEMVLASLPPVRPPVVRTTIDAALQEEVAGIIRSHRPVLTRHGAGSVAVVVLDNARGEWLAWEGSGNYFDGRGGGRINGPRVPRQPGSALKPFTYALAFEDGLTPASVLPDVPSHFPTAEAGVLYSPRNYDGQYRGPLLARRALAGSENVPAVVLAARLGTPRLLRFLNRAGLTTLTRNASHYGLGVTLGNAEVRLDELAAAYASFARGGRWVRPTWNPDTPVSGDERRVVSPRTAYWITDILSDPHAREFIFGRGGSLEFPFPVAVKTGTSQAYHDNWTIGYTRDVTVGVWVGNFDRKPLRDSSGVTGAGPIFHGVMLAAVRRARGTVPVTDVAPVVSRPDGLESRVVCALSGMRAGHWCPARQREWLASGNDATCAWHRSRGGDVVVAWPAEYRHWAREHGLLRGGTAVHDGLDTGPGRPAPAASSAAVAPQDGIRIVSPANGATFLIDPTLRREFQALALRAVTPAPVFIEWRVNGRRVGTGRSDAAVMWSLEPGTHVVAARDARGQVTEARITVR